MVALQLDTPFEASLNNARTVVGAEWLYEGVRSAVGKVISVYVLFLVGAPVAFVIGFMISRKRKKFQKQMRRDVTAFKSHEQYLSFKEYHYKLGLMMPALKKVLGYNIKNTPFFLQYPVREMQKMSSTLTTYHCWLSKKVEVLNKSRFKSTTNTFKLVSEEDLWKKRNNAYQYWL